MKTKLFISILMVTATLLAGCQWEEEDYDQWHKTKAGRTAYLYMETNMKSLTNIVAYTKMFRQYIRQTTVEGRDSVNALYFRNIKILRERDLQHNQFFYNMLVKNEYGQILYIISFFNTSSTDWKIDAAVSSGDGKLYYHLQVKDVDANQWTIEKSWSDAKESTVVKSDSTDATNVCNRLSRTAFIMKNKPLTVTWSSYSDYPHFALKGEGELESCATPQLKLLYSITQPFEVITLPKYLDAKNLRSSDANQTYVSSYEGDLRLIAIDTIDRTTDTYDITLTYDEIYIKMNDIKESWQR